MKSKRENILVNEVQGNKTETNYKIYSDSEILSIIKGGILPNSTATDAEKLLLISIVLDNAPSQQTNAEFGKFLGKHPVTISKHINNLAKHSFLEITICDDQTRLIQLSEFAKPLLYYNYSIISYKNKDKIIINNGLSEKVTSAKIRGTSLALRLKLLSYDPESIREHLQSIPLPEWTRALITGSIGKVTRDFLNSGIKQGNIKPFQDLNEDYMIASIENALCSVFRMNEISHTSKSELMYAEKQVLRQKQEKSIERYGKKMWEEGLIDFTDDYEGFQNKASVGKQVKITARLDRIWLGGNPPYGNLDLTMACGNEIKCALLNHVYRPIAEELQDHVGRDIQVMGTVIKSVHFKCNTIKSSKNKCAVKFYPNARKKNDNEKLDTTIIKTN